MSALEELTDLLEECYNNPIAFNDYFLDGKPFWSRQEEIARSVVEYRTTCVYSGNMLGKDFLFARLMLWWLYTRPDSLVVVTGPTQQQIGTILWKEVLRAVQNVDIPFTAHITRAAQASPQQINLGNGHQALGFSTKSVERASGQHAGQLLVLVIEGSGVEDEIWDAIESLGYDRLAINGNPIRAEGRFVDLIRQADKDKQDEIPPRLAINAIKIPSTESPHAEWEKSPFGLADKTWIESAGRRYGPKSLWYRSHVLAEIPEVSADILISTPWFDHACCHSRRTVPPSHPVHATRRISCDLGEGVGRDSSCVLVRDDWGVLACIYGSAMGLAEAAECIWRYSRDFRIPAEHVTYDRLGIGKGFPNHLARHGLNGCKPYAGSGTPRDRIGFTNLRSEAAWKMRNRLDPDYCPDIRHPQQRQEPFHFCGGTYQERLRAELKPLTYECYGNAIKILDKDLWKEALDHSPDIADALIQSFSW